MKRFTLPQYWCSFRPGGKLSEAKIAFNPYSQAERSFIRVKSCVNGVKEKSMHNPFIHPLIALLAGILILIMPRLLSYIVALYLIIIGILGLAPHLLR